MSDETLPRAIYSETLDMLGHRCTVHVLDNGTRVFEDTPEFRALLADLGVDAAALAHRVTPEEAE